MFSLGEAIIAIVGLFVAAVTASIIAQAKYKKLYKALGDKYVELEEEYKDLVYHHYNPLAKYQLDAYIEEGAKLEILKSNLDDFYKKSMLTREEYEEYYKAYKEKGGTEPRCTCVPYMEE